MYSLEHHPDRMHDMHAGEHIPGHGRQMEEEHRKESMFREFHEDSNGSPTRMHEQHGDRNK